MCDLALPGADPCPLLLDDTLDAFDDHRADGVELPTAEGQLLGEGIPAGFQFGGVPQGGEPAPQAGGFVTGLREMGGDGGQLQNTVSPSSSPATPGRRKCWRASLSPS